MIKEQEINGLIKTIDYMEHGANKLKEQFDREMLAILNGKATQNLPEDLR